MPPLLSTPTRRIHLKTHILNYIKTRDVYARYKKAGYSKSYLVQYEGDILLHKAAKKAFDEFGVTKLPTVRSLQEEYAQLLTEKKHAYTEYRSAREVMRELLIHKTKVDELLDQKGHELEGNRDRTDNLESNL